MQHQTFTSVAAMGLLGLFLTACATGTSENQEGASASATATDTTVIDVKLSGAEEVPAVSSSGAGSGNFTIGRDNSVSGSVTTTGIDGTAAHIHEAARGENGPVVIPLAKNGDTYSVPPGTKLTGAQLASFKAGKLYVNVHTAANPGGELRGQLVP